MDVTHVDVKTQLSKKQIFATDNDLVVQKSSLPEGPQSSLDEYVAIC